MANFSNKSFLTFLLNFQEHYKNFALSYKGQNLHLYLNQFANGQIETAQNMYGDQYAEQLRLYAERLPHLISVQLN